ncbi:MAG: TMEM43 family protein, partial [bacterium]
YSESHGNPQKSIESYTNKAMTAKIGVYSFDPQSITLPKLESYSINSENIIPDPKVKLANNQYLYIGIGEQGTLGNPEIGDLRISYHVLKPGFTGTIFGKLNGDNVESYLVKDSSTLYRLFTGTRDESIATLNTEHLFLLWGIRLGGFLFMWVGLIALFAPISVVLDVIPVFGQISLLLTFIVCFVIALILSVVTIFVSMLIHNVIALIIAIFLILGLFVWLFMKIKNKKSLLLNAVSKISPIPPSQPMI